MDSHALLASQCIPALTDVLGVQEEEKKNEVFQKVLTVGLPFMVGWFALNLPAGLSLYYFSNITLTSAQQIWLRKLGGEIFTPSQASLTLCCVSWCVADEIAFRACSGKLPNPSPKPKPKPRSCPYIIGSSPIDASSFTGMQYPPPPQSMLLASLGLGKLLPSAVVPYSVFNVNLVLVCFASGNLVAICLAKVGGSRV